MCVCVHVCVCVCVCVCGVCVHVYLLLIAGLLTQNFMSLMLDKLTRTSSLVPSPVWPGYEATRRTSRPAWLQEVGRWAYPWGYTQETGEGDAVGAGSSQEGYRERDSAYKRQYVKISPYIHTSLICA